MEQRKKPKENIPWENTRDFIWLSGNQSLRSHKTKQKFIMEREVILWRENKKDLIPVDGNLIFPKK